MRLYAVPSGATSMTFTYTSTSRASVSSCRWAVIAPITSTAFANGAVSNVRRSLRRASALWSAELTEQRRWRAWLEMVAPRLARFDASFALRDDRLIRERITQAFGEQRIEDLPTTLRSAATDAATGAATIPERGSLAAALRASMAVPVIFPSAPAPR